MPVKRNTYASDERPGALCAFWLDEEGSYLIETALAMPMFFMVIFLFISTSLALFVYGNLTYGAEAAVRFATVHSNTSVSPCTIMQIREAAVNGIMTAAGGTVTTSANWSPTNTLGSTVTVSVTAIYPTILPFIGQQNWTLTASAVGSIIN